jgi:hypothetical protein
MDGLFWQFSSNDEDIRLMVTIDFSIKLEYYIKR